MMDSTIEAIKEKINYRKKVRNSRKWILGIYMAINLIIFAFSTFFIWKNDVHVLSEESPLPVSILLIGITLLAGVICMHTSIYYAKRNEILLLKTLLSIHLALITIYLLGFAWSYYTLLHIQSPGINYLFTTLAWFALNIIGGLTFSSVLLFQTHQYQIHSKNLDSILLAGAFYDFLLGLWGYLLIFMLFVIW
ncbi:hypothetical protein AAG747_12255 [Rapidithrix thailandica]|uniref:Uncharacterized protein n=1 Tax=Rapidithrix thailandica TaxID=413964 RepID=A0AAW9SBH6_9BACT